MSTEAAQAKAAMANGTGDIEKAAEKVVDVTKVSAGFGNLGQGFIGLSIALYAGAFAVSRFQRAFKNK